MFLTLNQPNTKKLISKYIFFYRYLPFVFVFKINKKDDLLLREVISYATVTKSII